MVLGRSFGRCPVRSIFEDALKLLVQEQKKVMTGSGLFTLQ